MGVTTKLFYVAVLAGLTLLHFSACVSSASSTNLDTNCTDCCNYLACSGLDNIFDNPNFTIDMFYDHLCSKINIAVMPTCFSKSNLEGCSYMKRLLTANIPTPEALSNSFVEMCSQRTVIDEMKNVSKCIQDSGSSMNVVNRCTMPYLNGMKDPNSDLCDVMKTMSQCIVGILKATKCDEKFVTIYDKYENQMTTNQFCTKPSNGSQREILHVGLFILAVLYFIC